MPIFTYEAVDVIFGSIYFYFHIKTAPNLQDCPYSDNLPTFPDFTLPIEHYGLYLMISWSRLHLKHEYNICFDYSFPIFFSDVNIVLLSNRSQPLFMLPSLLPPFFLTNSISNSYMDLSLVLGIKKKVKTASTRDVVAARNITPLVPKMLTRLGNA